MKKRAAIVFISCVFCINVFAQKDTTGYVHKGLLRAILTYSLGELTMISNQSTVYVTGNMEYYADNKISVRGDACFFINSGNANSLLKENHQLYFGACYNFPVHSHFVPFVGLQPGLAYTKLYYTTRPAVFDPLASGIAGINYFASKWFNLMINVRYTMGNYLDEQALFSLNEITFSFGLGWDIDVLKSK